MIVGESHVEDYILAKNILSCVSLSIINDTYSNV